MDWPVVVEVVKNQCNNVVHDLIEELEKMFQFEK
jgi:hypothetical protein